MKSDNDFLASFFISFLYGDGRKYRHPYSFQTTDSVADSKQLPIYLKKENFPDVDFFVVEAPNDVNQSTLEVEILSDTISREEFFSKGNSAITVVFKQSSQAYKEYGRMITVQILNMNNELLENLTSKPTVATFGHLNVKNLNKTDLSDEQILAINTYGFDTSEVLEIHYKG